MSYHSIWGPQRPLSPEGRAIVGSVRTTPLVLGGGFPNDPRSIYDVLATVPPNPMHLAGLQVKRDLARLEAGLPVLIYDTEGPSLFSPDAITKDTPDAP